jgi:hypothetical protein
MIGCAMTRNDTSLLPLGEQELAELQADNNLKVCMRMDPTPLLQEEYGRDSEHTHESHDIHVPLREWVL